MIKSKANIIVNDLLVKSDKISRISVRCIIIISLFIVLWLPLMGCRNESTPEAAGQKEIDYKNSYIGTIVAVGDSLTAGFGVDESEAYPALLEKKLFLDGYYFKVVNAGISGETSSGALSRIQWVVSSLNPDIIILETGANDGLRGIDPDVLRRNLDEIVTALKRNNVEVVLAGMKMLPNLGPAYITHFAKIYPEVARKHKILLIPFFLESVAGDTRFNQPDGIHPNQDGYRRIVDYIYPYVLEAVKKYQH